MSEIPNDAKLNRRQALLLPGHALAWAPRWPTAPSPPTAPRPPPTRSRATARRRAPRSPRRNTARCAAIVDGGVFTFKGIPYGQTTGGENRWLPAKPPKPWDGEYPALIYGANCPQRLH